MDQLRAEFHETVVQLNRKFNRYMRNQSHQIERQQDELNHQCGVIEELAWQIRDLRDSLRKCNDQISRLQSKYCVECAKNHMKLNIPAANRAHPTSEHVAGRKIAVSISFAFIIHIPHFIYAQHDSNCVQLRMNVVVVVVRIRLFV